MKYNDIFDDEAHYDIEVSGFLNLIRNAEYVFTDYFYRTPFSLINDVNFFTVRRYEIRSRTICD